MKIGQRDSDTSICLVAEIGNNHEGSITLAKEMIDQAFAAGADAVKLQTFVPELYVSRVQVDRLETLRRFTIPNEDLQDLLLEYSSCGRILFSTPFDLTSLGRLLTTPLLKISSGDLTFTQLLEAAARAKKSMIISSGAATLAEVEAAVSLINRIWQEVDFDGSLAVLHCVSSYPAPADAVNLRAIGTLQRHFPDVVIGYSDHTLGIDVAVTAAAAGARIIEKHFTLDKNYSDFRDHQLSADPRELSQLRQRLDELDLLLGTGIKEPQSAEIEMRSVIRRSVTTVRALPAGCQLNLDDLCIVRPGQGVEPAQLNRLLGRTLARNVGAGQAILEEDLA